MIIGKASGAVLTQLEADGFDVNAADMGMLDASADIQARQEAFVAKHGLAEGASTEAVCAAARAEMADGTDIGTYLVEVAE